MTKDEALNMAFAWYGSGNQDPDEFEKLILSIVAQRTWVGLTQEEIEDSYNADYKAQTRDIEAKLKEKNT